MVGKALTLSESSNEDELDYKLLIFEDAFRKEKNINFYLIAYSL